MPCLYDKTAARAAKQKQKISIVRNYYFNIYPEQGSSKYSTNSILKGIEYLVDIIYHKEWRGR